MYLWVLHFNVDVINLGWTIVYIEGITYYSFQRHISFSEDHFVIANSVDPDKMPQCISFESFLFA